MFYLCLYPSSCHMFSVTLGLTSAAPPVHAPMEPYHYGCAPASTPEPEYQPDGHSHCLTPERLRAAEDKAGDADAAGAERAQRKRVNAPADHPLWAEAYWAYSLFSLLQPPEKGQTGPPPLGAEGCCRMLKVPNAPPHPRGPRVGREARSLCPPPGHRDRHRLKRGGGTPSPLPNTPALTLPERHSHPPTPAPTAFPTASNRPPPNRFHIPCARSTAALELPRSPPLPFKRSPASPPPPSRRDRACGSFLLRGKGVDPV